jgi:hypothetical protein
VTTLPAITVLGAGIGPDAEATPRVLSRQYSLVMAAPATALVLLAEGRRA